MLSLVLVPIVITTIICFKLKSKLVNVLCYFVVEVVIHVTDKNDDSNSIQMKPNEVYYRVTFDDIKTQPNIVYSTRQELSK